MEIAHLKSLGWLTRIRTWVWHETAVPDSCIWLSCWAWHQPPVPEIILLSLTLFSRINFTLLGLTSSNCFWHHSAVPITVLLGLASFCPVWQDSGVSCHHPAMSDITLPRVTSFICPWNHPGGPDTIQLCLTTSSCAWHPLPEPQSMLLGLTSLKCAWNHPSVYLISSHCDWYHPAGLDIIQLCLTQSSVPDIILLSLTTFPCVCYHADGHRTIFLGCDIILLVPDSTQLFRIDIILCLTSFCGAWHCLDVFDIILLQLASASMFDILVLKLQVVNEQIKVMRRKKKTCLLALPTSS